MPKLRLLKKHAKFHVRINTVIGSSAAGRGARGRATVTAFGFHSNISLVREQSGALAPPTAGDPRGVRADSRTRQVAPALVHGRHVHADAARSRHDGLEVSRRCAHVPRRRARPHAPVSAARRQARASRCSITPSRIFAPRSMRRSRAPRRARSRTRTTRASSTAGGPRRVH